LSLICCRFVPAFRERRARSGSVAQVSTWSTLRSGCRETTATPASRQRADRAACQRRPSVQARWRVRRVSWTLARGPSCKRPDGSRGCSVPGNAEARRPTRISSGPGDLRAPEHRGARGRRFRGRAELWAACSFAAHPGSRKRRGTCSVAVRQCPQGRRLLLQRNETRHLATTRPKGDRGSCSSSKPSTREAATRWPHPRRSTSLGATRPGDGGLAAISVCACNERDAELPIGRALLPARSRDATPDRWKLVLTRKQVPEYGVLVRLLTGRRRAQCRSAGIAGVPDLRVRDRDALVLRGHSCEFDA
jgi:hypothetical protein